STSGKLTDKSFQISFHQACCDILFIQRILLAIKRLDGNLFLFILLLKVGLDCLVLSMCLRWLHTSFMGVCGLSVFLVDVVLLCSVVAVWFLGPARSPVSICFLLAHASAMFNALPLPVLGLGLLDYASEPRYTTCHEAPCRDLWNYALTLLVWGLAGVHSCLGISVAICCVMLLHYKQMPLWLKEANRLSEQRDNVNPMLQSHLRFRPPLYLSLTLDFGTTWASYLVMCIACELLGLAVPAYISINLLWLECANSVLVGLVFCVGLVTKRLQDQIPKLTRYKSVVLPVNKAVNPLFLGHH
uniref:Uncharacterized protein n=1 Tax=Oncorhynchus tshawytscha TaxID=74940 RepID=A0A8C8C0M6_ONCTS